jgi:hypothetical protein
MGMTVGIAPLPHMSKAPFCEGVKSPVRTGSRA